MNATEASTSWPEGTARRGLWRLMLKLPAVRGQLQVLSREGEFISGLCEAYEDASAMLHRIQSNPNEHPKNILIEYQEICLEIEEEIIRTCLGSSRSASK